MSYDVLIGSNGADAHKVIDRLRIKTDSTGTTDFIPPHRSQYAKLTVYRNGTYSAGDYGYVGFVEVVVAIGSRSDGRCCDVDVNTGGNYTFSIIEGGKVLKLHANTLKIRTGKSVDSAGLVEWHPITAFASTTTTLSHQGTYTPPSDTAWSAVTVDVASGELPSEYEEPPAYSVGDSGNLLKLYGRYKDHFWAFGPEKAWSPGGGLSSWYWTEAVESYCTIDIACAVVYRGNRDKFVLSSDGEIQYQGQSVSANPNASVPHISVPLIGENQTRKTKNVNVEQYGYYREWVADIRIKIKIGFYVKMPKIKYTGSEYHNGIRSYYDKTKYDISPGYMYSHDINAIFAAENTRAEATHTADDYSFSVGVYTDYTLGKMGFSISGTPIIPYYGTLWKRSSPYDDFIKSDYSKNISVKPNQPSRFIIPITDILYLGDDATAPDWAKTITDYDL